MTEPVKISGGGQQPHQPQGQPTNGSQGGGQRKFESASQILARANVGGAASPQADAYCKALAEGVRNNIAQRSGLEIPEVKCLPVPNPKLPVFRLVVTDPQNKDAQGQLRTYSILLAFSESYKAPHDTPWVAPAKYLEDSAVALSKAGIFVMTTLVVPPSAYDLVIKMSAFITQTVLSEMMPEVFTIPLGSLKRDGYKIRTRIADVRRVIEENNPVGINPPINVGFEVYTNPSDRNEEEQLVLAIGANTTFVSSSPTGTNLPGSGAQTRAVTTINSIYSPTPSLPLAMWGITLAVDTLINRRVWIEQFANFKKPKSKDEITDENIGNLGMIDNKLMYVDNPQALYAFIETQLAKPHVLALDVTNGAPRISGIEKLCANMATEDLAEFIGCSPAEIGFPSSCGNYFQYTGAFGDGTDTRSQTYLRLCADNPAGFANYSAFLVRNSDYQFTLRELANLFNHRTIDPLYLNCQTYLEGKLLRELTRRVSPHLNVVWESDNGAINNLGDLPGGESVQYGDTIMYGIANQGGAQAATGGFNHMVYGAHY